MFLKAKILWFTVYTYDFKDLLEGGEEEEQAPAEPDLTDEELDKLLTGAENADVYEKQDAGRHRKLQIPSNAYPYKVGDSVVVATSGAAARKALLLGFGMPLVLLLVVLAAMLAAGIDEGTSALAALAVLAPYYLVLWLCRERIAGKITFHICF